MNITATIIVICSIIGSFAIGYMLGEGQGIFKVFKKIKHIFKEV